MSRRSISLFDLNLIQIVLHSQFVFSWIEPSLEYKLIVSVDTGTPVWSESYDRKLDDVFKIQDDIARAVVDKLRLTLLGGEVPRPDTAVVNPQVYNLYLQGRYLITSDTAEDLVKEAMGDT